MAAKSILFLSCFLLLNVSVGWSEGVSEKINEPAGTQIEEENAKAAAEQADPYGDVTWDSVINKNKEQKQEVTVYRRETKDAEFISVSSTGSNTAPASDVAVVVPTKKKSNRWVFW